MFGFGHLRFRESFNKRLTASVLLITLSQFNFGFDQQGFSATQAMNSFDKQFGDFNEKTGTYVLDPVWVSQFNSFNYLGQATGVIIGSYVSKRFGRRMCMFTMSLWALVAAIVVITSKTRDQILVARVLNYVYIGMELAVVPVFQSEITPKHARGFIVGTYQISLFLGGLVINCVARGTGGLAGRAAYMIPWGLFFIVPTIVASCIWFLPESPRWLVLKDRGGDAIASLHTLRDGKFTDEQIEEEYCGIVEAVAFEINSKNGTFADMFKLQHRWRTVVVVGANFFLQATGQTFTSVYGALFAKSLGTINPFTVTVMLAVVNTCTALLAMVLTDRLGRRPQLFTGAIVQVASLMTMGALGTVSDPSRNIKSGIVAMMVIFTFGYALGWAPTAHILSAEIPALTVRDMTYRSASVLNIATQFAAAFSLPYLLNAPYADLGSRVGFIFGSISAVSLVFAYFFVPDVSGRSLEEVDQLFASDVPLRHFKSIKIDQVPQLNDRKDLEADDSVRVEKAELV